MTTNAATVLDARSRLLNFPPDAPLTLAEAATVAGISLRKLMTERGLGRGPKCYAIGGKTIRTTLGDVLEWIKAQPEGGAA